MILIVESALRSLALAAAVWAALAALRVRNPQLERIIWTTVLTGAIAMPAIVQWRLTSVFPSTSFALPAIAILAGRVLPGTYLVSMLRLPDQPAPC